MGATFGKRDKMVLRQGFSFLSAVDTSVAICRLHFTPLGRRKIIHKSGFFPRTVPRASSLVHFWISLPSQSYFIEMLHIVFTLIRSSFLQVSNSVLPGFFPVCCSVFGVIRSTLQNMFLSMRGMIRSAIGYQLFSMFYVICLFIGSSFFFGKRIRLPWRTGGLAPLLTQTSGIRVIPQPLIFTHALKICGTAFASRPPVLFQNLFTMRRFIRSSFLQQTLSIFTPVLLLFLTTALSTARIKRFRSFALSFEILNGPWIRNFTITADLLRGLVRHSFPFILKDIQKAGRRAGSGCDFPGCRPFALPHDYLMCGWGAL